MTYDLAFALVWAEDDEVLNVNEAHAYASCSDCVAVAVAFQVVLIMDDAQVVVPQNLAVAANYDCYRCITAAIASQLVLSVQEEPGEEELLALGEVWSQLIEFASDDHLALAHGDHRAARGRQGRDHRDPRGGADDGPGEVRRADPRPRPVMRRLTQPPLRTAGSRGTPAPSEPAPEQEVTPTEPTAEGTPTEPSSTPTEATEPAPASTPEEDTAGADGRLLALTRTRSERSASFGVRGSTGRRCSSSAAGCCTSEDSGN